MVIEQQAPAGADGTVALERLQKSFGADRVVRNVSLDIAEGEFFTIVGASGSGKSTLLRMIAGLETPDAGAIRLGGKDVTASPPYERAVNLVFQSYALFPHLSVRDNIAFGLRQEKLAGEEIASRTQDAMTRLSIDHLAGRKIEKLSGGERQRVALARAIVKRPPILLLDEPLAALDTELRERARRELVALRKSLGITFIMVTHDQADAVGMSDRIAVMRDGALLEVGPPQTLYDRPRYLYTATFLGEANAVSGKVVDRSGETLRLRTAGGEEVSAIRPADIAVSEEATMFVRPEHVRVSAAPAGENTVRAMIDTIEFLGARLRCHLVTAAGLRIMADIVRDGGPAFSPGDTVSASWATSAARVVI